MAAGAVFGRMRSKSLRDRIAIVTVHGTNDDLKGPREVPPEPDVQVEPKWWQPESRFSVGLISRLGARGLPAEIVAYRWGGANSDMARDRGARDLAKFIRKLSRTYGEVHVIAHSHGGNVADAAAELLRWGRRKNSPIKSLIAVGTPFLRRRSSLFERLSAVAFAAVTAIGVPVGIWSVVSYQPTFTGSLSGFAIGFAAALLLAFGPVLLTTPVALAGLRGVFQRRRPKRPEACVLAIRHGEDEAISFLRTVDELPLDPIPRGALFRASRNWGIALSVQIVIAAVLVASVAAATELATRSLGGGLSDAAAGGTQTGTLTDILLLAPTLFLLSYLAIRLVLGGGAELLGRPFLSKRFAGYLKGMAMGADGVQHIGDVQPESHRLHTKQLLLDPDVSERMKGAAAEQTARLIQKYRWSIFTERANSALSELANDVVTWRSLIHTTYFHQPELIELVADHICSKWASPAEPSTIAAE